MNVLSLFDGMSCGRIALEKLGIKVENYFAAEIDKFAITVSKKNYPDIKHIGDVTKVKSDDLPKIELLIGGSPCQGFSFAGKQLNFNDTRSKLFFEFVRLLKECKPKYFLLENVKMKKEYQDIISYYLNCKPIEINSSLVSAQNRKRLYWTNIPNVSQPKDKGIILRDILEDGSEKIGAKRGRYLDNGKIEQRMEVRKDFKSNCMTTVSKDNIVIKKDSIIVKEATKKGYVEAFEGGGIDLTFPNSKTRRGRLMKYKSNCLTAANYDYNVVINDKPKVLQPESVTYRKLTPLECERLQTVPDNYTNHVSNSQRYKMLGNGWTVDVIAHIFKNIPLT